jgi:ferrous iron transport protein A
MNTDQIENGSNSSKHAMQRALSNTSVLGGNSVNETNQRVTLDSVRPGNRVRIESISESNPELFRKLHVMGVYAGAIATVVCRAPLGDPISISTLGYVLSLRLSEAHNITVSLAPLT